MEKRIPWNQYLPRTFICPYCGVEFPNTTGHLRKYCSAPCRNKAKKGSNPPGCFKKGSEHWNYKKDRSKILNRHKERTCFTYSMKKELANLCGYSCQICNAIFPILPIYKLSPLVVFDHKIAIRLGGSHSIENGQMLCRMCDKIKTRNDKLAILHGYS